MPSLDQVIERASRLVTPSRRETEKLEAVASKVSSLLKNVFEKMSPSPDIKMGGSYARGTWLRGSLDIDYFLRFPPDYPRAKLESEAIEAAKSALKGYTINMRFAEHPYVEGFVDGVRVNLVPCYKVELGEWLSAADRSPYHTEYIKSKLDDRLKLEARLFKRFVKACGVYGAEVKVQGLSGYVCEVLTLKFGSFRSTIEGLAKANQNEVISIEKYDEDLAASFGSSLVILDPVDTTRNLGTAISARNVAKLVLQGRWFLSTPKISFFDDTAKVAKILKASTLVPNTLVVTFGIKKRSPDILWGQLRKSLAALTNKLENSGFQVLRSVAASDEISKAAFVIMFTQERLGKFYTRQGPEYFRAQEVEKYLSKNNRKAILTWINEEGRVQSVFSRDQVSTDATSALKKLLASRLESAGLSEEIRREIGRGFRIARGSAVTGKREDAWLSNAVRFILSQE